MTPRTLDLLLISLSIRTEKEKVKTLPYLKRALDELQQEIERRERINNNEIMAGRQEAAAL